MSSPELQPEVALNASLRQVRRLHRLFGYMDQPRAIWCAQQLLARLGNKSLPPKMVASCLELAAGLLRQALVLNPFDSALVALVNQTTTFCAFSREYALWFNLVQGFHSSRTGLSTEQAQSQLKQAGTTLQALFLRLQKESNPLILLLGILDLWQRGEWPPVRVLAERLLAMPVGCLVGPLLAWAAWSAGEAELAGKWAALPGPDTYLRLNLKAEMALARGDRAQAMLYWKKSLEIEHGQPALNYRFWELEQAAAGRAEASVDRKKVHVAFYTFNKLEETLRTLESLLRSDIGPARVTLLNNGSTAFSPRDLEQGVTDVARGRAVNLIHLPVNIGAPAARNWLWHLPEMNEADYVAFLDDDVLLPRNWLSCFIEDLERFPRAVVAGPKVLNPGSLPTIQYVYRFFQEVGDHKILFTPTAPLPMNFEHYSYRRPCLSVMGCCHLFDRSRAKALAIPDFDVRFSPSQVDDLEHDIQIWNKGGQVVYDGRVAVVHLQDAGRQATQSRASWGHVWGNHMKMESKFTAGELFEIDRRVNEADDRFFLEMEKAAEPSSARS